MTAPLSMDQIAWAMTNRDTVLRKLSEGRAEESLIGFMRYTWPVLEPAQPFTEGWAVQAICDHLEAVTRGDVLKLLINVPPGCTKSLTTNVFWPAWEWGPKNMPSMRYVTAAYTDSLTIRDNRRMRQLVQSDQYMRGWGDIVKLSPDEANKQKFSNTSTGFKIASSVRGSVMGERGDRIIVDDPNNTKEVDSEPALNQALQWFTEVLPTRISTPGSSAIVVIMQRTHERDVSGHILANELGYEHLCLPMEFEPDRRSYTSIGFEDPRTEEGELLWPERFSRDYLENDLKPQLRSWGGSFAESGQLQQRPTPRGGGMFQEKDFQYLDKPPARIKTRVRGWDLASSKKSDAAFTAGVLMSLTPDDDIVIEDVDRGQWSPGEVATNIRTNAERDGASVIIDLPQDPGQAGKHQISSFTKLLHGFDVRSSPESGAKEDRARPLAAQAEGGNVYLVRGPWNTAFVREAASFPRGKWKDQIDAATRAYAALLKRPAKRKISGPVALTR